MYTGGARGFESRCPAYGSLAQWTERLVTSQDVAGSSPARPTEHGSASCFRGVRPVWRLLRWRGVALFGLRASRWACYYALIAARCPPGLPSCIVSVAELADALDLGSSAFGRVGSTPTGRTSGRSFLYFLLPLAFHSCYDGWDAARRVSSIWQNTSLVN